MPLLLKDLGLTPYNQAWEIQQRIHQQVLEGQAETLILVEHPPVITLGRRPMDQPNLIASEAQLATLGVELVQSDRGGDITFHGPGQIVAYPIIRLARHGLSVSGYVHRLEAIVIAALAEMGIVAQTDPTAVGIWTGGAKIGAIGVRIRRGVTMHGVALNVNTNLDFFNLIVPCGLARPVTSVRKVLGDQGPGFEEVKRVLTKHLLSGFDS